MYTVIALLLLFLITVFSILLYFRSKKSTLALLENGICPVCHSEPKKFKDENTGVLFSVDVIEQNILQKHGCSGTMEVEFICKNCGHKEVHTTTGGGCSL